MDKRFCSRCERAEKSLAGCADWWIASLDERRIVNTHAMKRLRNDGLLGAQLAKVFWDKSGLVFGSGSKGLQVNLWTELRWTETC